MGAALRWYARFLGTQPGGHGEALTQTLDDLPKYKPPARPPKRPLRDEEWRRLADEARREKEPLATVLWLLCASGLRVNVDLGGLERERVEEAVERGVLFLKTKGGEYRSYPAKGYRHEFETLLRYEWDLLWQAITKKSEHAYYMQMHRGLRRCAKRADIDPKRVHPHLMRTTTATQLLRTQKDITRVQKLLGHKQITTTQIYTDYLDPEEMEEDMDALSKLRGGQDADG
jgi:integrase/recombinase XerD